MNEIFKITNYNLYTRDIYVTPVVQLCLLFLAKSFLVAVETDEKQHEVSGKFIR